MTSLLEEERRDDVFSGEPQRDRAPIGCAPPSGSLAEVRLQMSKAELRKLFPPVEGIGKCAPRLIGGDVPAPTLVSEAEKKALSQCARALDPAGLSSP
jgi:hypothetical protein